MLVQLTLAIAIAKQFVTIIGISWQPTQVKFFLKSNLLSSPQGVYVVKGGNCVLVTLAEDELLLLLTFVVLLVVLPDDVDDGEALGKVEGGIRDTEDHTGRSIWRKKRKEKVENIMECKNKLRRLASAV
ncbi:hypothetical protein CVT25_003584 [Psilocybe cyanescens]|uniref:Uncharacterized protein n=1 Tax=Psilocybe cyanescens TaxID=93625 RepID=A0A409X6J6_PSICY|nr:hypothetical protein CVT25_003584 [Psilocybe cyanescens]